VPWLSEAHLREINMMNEKVRIMFTILVHYGRQDDVQAIKT
jgi:hypothetical protein